MKKKIKKITLVLIAIMGMMTSYFKVNADVGSFESYSSGGSSSWSSGSSWDSSSSWDSGSSSSYSSNDYSGDEDLSFGEIVLVTILLIIIVAIISGIESKRAPKHQNRTSLTVKEVLYKREESVEEKIKQVDPMFNKEEFIANAKNLFIKLQQAWTARDWSVIRVFETNELFEQHKNQLQGYIDNNQINVMDRICVNYATLTDFRQEGDKDIITVRLNSRMADYIIDATTKEVIRGDKYTERVNTYVLTFIRKKGLQTKEGTEKINTTNCPNCGAPTQITSAGKCEYCGSVITTGEHSWVLSNLERERV